MENELSEAVSAEIQEAIEEARDEVQEAIHEAREEIEEAVEEAPHEVRRILHELDIEELVDQAIRRAPAFVQQVLRQVEVEKTARKALRRIEPDYRPGAAESPLRDPSRAKSSDRSGDTEALQRRIGRLESQLQTLLEEIEGIRRELRAASSKREP